MEQPEQQTRSQALYHQALQAHKAGRYDLAFEACKQILAVAPDHFDALHLAGVVLLQAGQPRPALPLLDRAMALRPGDANVHYNRGLAHRELEQDAQAEADFRQAMALAPRHAAACTNLANLYRDQNRLAEAKVLYERSLALRPGHALTRFNLGLCLLKAGEYPEGFRHYEARHEVQAIQPRLGALRSPQPQWTGDASIQGKTVLLHAEQGLGDAIQFCRYAPLVAQQGARVVLQAGAPLVALMRSLPGVREVVASDATLPPHDLHCPLMSLPLALRTTVDTVPARTPYLRTDPARSDQWQRRLGPRRSPRIGLVWSGRPQHQQDRHRSLPLAQLLPSLPAGAEYVSLQVEVRERDRGPLAASVAAGRIRDFAGELRDFMDTAALCELVDLVVAVDTSVAHLAGALARPTWLLLPFNPDWRWLLDRADSPWYPQMRLYRQAAPGAWGPVLERLGRDLGARVAAAT